MRVLVTGSSGFIGRHLMLRLRHEPQVKWLVGVSRSYDELPHTISPAQGLATESNFFCDLTEEWQVKGLMQEVKPDVIFHLAANPLVKDEDIKSSLLPTLSLLSHAPQGSRFVFASSATVYGDSADGAREEQRLTPSAVYGAGKAASELLVDVKHKQGKVNGLCLRLVANVGRFATHGVVPDIIRKLSSDSHTLELLGAAPGSRKSFLHVSDTVEGFVQFGFNPAINGALNLSNDDTCDVSEIAEMVMKTTGMRKPIRWNKEGNWVGDNRLVRPSNLKARQLGWCPSHSSLGAIRKTVLEIERG